MAFFVKQLKMHRFQIAILDVAHLCQQSSIVLNN
jgi:hypothetical protein